MDPIGKVLVDHHDIGKVQRLGHLPDVPPDRIQLPRLVDPGNRAP